MRFISDKISRPGIDTHIVSVSDEESGRVWSAVANWTKTAEGMVLVFGNAVEIVDGQTATAFADAMGNFVWHHGSKHGGTGRVVGDPATTFSHKKPVIAMEAPKGDWSVLIVSRKNHTTMVLTEMSADDAHKLAGILSESGHSARAFR